MPKPRRLGVPDALALVQEHLKAGRAAQAESIAGQLAEQLPDHPDALYLHAAALRALGRPADALGPLKTLVERRPELLRPALELGALLIELGRIDDAVAHYAAAAERFPESADCAFNHGVALLKSGQAEAALARFESVSRIWPDLAAAKKGLGSAFRSLGRLKEAEAVLREAIAAAPVDPENHVTLGNVLRDQGRLEEAVAAYDAGLVVEPVNVTGRYNRALALLTSGELASGFAEYEAARFAQYAADPARFPGKGRLPVEKPPWDGADLAGRSILLHTEQGAGDAIQFARYVPLVAARGAGRVTLLCPPALGRLFQGLSGADAVVTDLAAAGSFDCFASLVSLPALLETTLATVPADCPYLRPPDEAVALDAPEGSLKVGIVWSGSVTYLNNARRRGTLDDLAPLFDRPGAVFFSLQKGPPVTELAAFGEAGRIVDLAGRLSDYASTAALIDALDLVIATDTAVPHLAGALAKPVWVLLSEPADWRWLRGRDDCPWYPTMRLFRQKKRGDWSGPVARVRAALEAHASAS